MKKKINGLLVLFLVFTCIFGGVSSASAAAKQIKLNKENVILIVGETTTLKLENTDQKAKWSSSKKSVATVSSSGKVKAVKAGTAKITAEVSGKKYTCKVTVKNADATATALEFKNTSGGDFIKGISTATVSFTLNQASTAVQVYIMDENDKSVYKKNFSKCKADTEYSFEWDGKNTKGIYVGDGNYKAVVKAGSIKTTSFEITFYTTSDFEKGDGSQSNPYIVSSIAELTAVAKHNGRYFEQSQDLDAEYNSISCLYTYDVPFQGSYDGNGYSIINILNTNDSDYYGIFRAIGSEGSISNLTVKDSTFSGKYIVGIIVGCNRSGTISNCTVENCQVASSDIYAGGLCGYNTTGGKILSCTMSNNTIISRGDRSFYYEGSSIAGGVCGRNDGVITSCTSSNDNIKASKRGAGGITGYNTGNITKCTVKEDTISGLFWVGGISGMNDSIISNCEVYDNQGLIYCTNNWSGDYKAAGIIGYNTGTNTNNVYYGNLSQAGTKR